MKTLDNGADGMNVGKSAGHENDRQFHVDG